MMFLGIRFTSAGHLAYAAFTLLSLASAYAFCVIGVSRGQNEPVLPMVGCAVHAWVSMGAYVRIHVWHESPNYGAFGMAPDCIWFNAVLALAYGGLAWLLLK